MFPVRKRLKREDFKALARGRRRTSPHFTAVLPLGVEGYAVIVPKKMASLSVTRHRIKRRVFAALRTLTLPPAVAVFPKKGVEKLSYQEVATELKALLA